jgi:2-succinyl-6-hydroxy-2,4-cyclohexadiene-1-carboxylate synthase
LLTRGQGSVPGVQQTFRDDARDRWSVWTRGAGPRSIVALHGFTGSGQDWDRLPWGGRLIAPDLPGHGGTQLRRETTSVDRCANSLDAIIPEESEQLLMGYSMGGRTALRWFLQAPDRFVGLVLVGSTAGIDGQPARTRRRADDEARARRIEQGGVAAFQAEWEQVGLLRSQLELPPAVRGPMRERRLANRAAGLAASLRGMGAGSMTPMWDRLGAIHRPVLLVVGERDVKYRALAERLIAGLPRATLVVLPKAGHMAWLEALPPFVQAVGAWMQEALDPPWAWIPERP